MDNILEIIEKEKLSLNILRSKNLYLMGRIEHCCQIAEWLCSKGLSVKAILDNDEAKQGLYADDIPILSPGQALQPFRDDAFIIIYSPKYWAEMCAQLSGYGYCEKGHVYVLDKPSLRKNIYLVKKGLALYHKLQREFGKDVLIFLANCPLGDYYLLGLYFFQYCKEHRIKNYVIAGTSRGIEKLSPLFHFKKVKRLTDEESNALIRAWIFLGGRTIHMKPLTIWQGAFRFNSCQARQKNGFNFLNTFTTMIYSLEFPVPQYPDFPRDKQSVEALFQKNRLQPGRTIILSPFSYSLQSLPVSFWIKLAELLAENGYSVAVNIGEEREYNFLPNTVALQLEFPEIMEALELAGTVIGMRSGFFDITAQAKCRRIILYPLSLSRDVIWNSTDIEFCSLKQMRLCDDAYEWTVENERDIFQRIAEVLWIKRKKEDESC